MKGKFEERDRPDLFASMPPLEAKKLLFKMAATQRGVDNMKSVMQKKRPLKLMLIDVRKAHLNSICEDDVYVELPEEARAGPGMCGKLRRWLYGCRKAGQA